MLSSIRAESMHIALGLNGRRVRISFTPRDDRPAGRAMPSIELSQRAAGRLGRALVRKEAQITGIAGVAPVVADGLALFILHEVYDTLTAAQGDGLNPVDRRQVATATAALCRVLARIESGVSHG